MSNTRRQELTCAAEELALYGDIILLENENLYVVQSDGTRKVITGDGITKLSALPYSIDWQSAVSAAEEALAVATISKSYAVGGTGTRPGEDTDNAKYYMEQAGDIAGANFLTPSSIEDSLNSSDPKRVLSANQGRILNISKEELLKNAPETATMGENDNLIIVDNTDELKTKRLDLSGLKAILKSYFDTLYNNYFLPIASASTIGGIKSGTDITVDLIGNVSVNDNSHNHLSANITDLNTTLSTFGASYVPKTGATMTGKLIGASNTEYTTAQFRNIIISSEAANATLMKDGELWLRI